MNIIIQNKQRDEDINVCGVRHVYVENGFIVVEFDNPENTLTYSGQKYEIISASQERTYVSDVMLDE